MLNIFACLSLMTSWARVMTSLNGKKTTLMISSGSTRATKGVNLSYSIDLSTARPKWPHDGPALSGHLLYSLVNHTYANRYHHHLV